MQVDVPSADIRRPRGLTPRGQLGERARRRRHALQEQWRARMRRIEQEPAEPRALPRWSPAVVAAPVALLAAGCGVEIAASPAILVVVLTALAVLGLGEVLREPVGDLTDQARPYWVVYQRQPAWQLGESSEAAWSRRAKPEVLADDQRYPDDYAGRIVSVIAGAKPKPGWACGDLFDAALLDLTEEQRRDAAGRRAKIAAGKLSPVVIGDRLGATVGLTDKYTEAELLAVRDHLIEQNETDAARDRRMLVERAVDAAVNALPKTDAHTGTGLYCVKVTPNHNDDTQSGAVAGQVVTLTIGGLGTADAWKGGYVTNATRSQTRAIVSHTDDTVTLEGDITTWADTDDLDLYDAWDTVQGALDQLWTDQGATTFGAAQYIRIFAGTYDEYITPNASFVGHNSGYGLVIEGDPDDDRANVALSPSAGGNYTLTINDPAGARGAVVRHLSFAGAPDRSCLFVGNQTARVWVDDCALAPTSTPAYPVLYLRNSVLEDSTVTKSGGNSPIVYSDYWAGQVRRCVIKGAGAGEGSSHCGISSSVGAAIVEATTIADCYTGIMQTTPAANAPHGQFIRNVTIYNCTVALGAYCAAQWHVANLVAKDCTYVVQAGLAGPWPEFASTHVGSVYVMRNNCYHGYTAFAYDGTDTKTYAQFGAFDLVDASGDLDATDPLLTAPGSDDFSLQSNSPCRRRGAGAGVTTGVNGVEFSSTTPDIGAWSSGAGDLTAPTLSSVADDESGTTVTASITATNAQKSVWILYRQIGTSAWTRFATPRTGSGDLQVTGLTTATYEFMAVESISSTYWTAGLSPTSSIVTTAVTTGAAITMEAAFRRLCLDDATVSGLIGSRWYPERAPQSRPEGSTQEPFVVYHIVSEVPERQLLGPETLTTSRIQVDAYADDFDTARSVADAIRLATDGYSGTVTSGSGSKKLRSITLEDRRMGHEDNSDEIGWCVVSIDYAVRHFEELPAFLGR